MDLPVFKESVQKEVHIGVDNTTRSEQFTYQANLAFNCMLFFEGRKEKPPAIKEITG